jgi:hypothetical protein
MATKAKVATEKVWRTYKNKLVPDGHEEAAQLLARKGEIIQEADLRHYSNTSDFFVDVDSREGEDAQRHIEPRKKAWTREQIEAYRDARESEEPSAARADKAGPKEPKRVAAAEKVRRSRPGPEKGTPKAKKAKAAK